MADGVPDFATYAPGVDSHLNGSRRQGVPFAVLHRTQGNDSRGLGTGRHHSTPGTFQFLIREETGVHCFYPATVRCTHAAGGNDGVGVEMEGWNGEPLGPNQVRLLGQMIRWLHDAYGVPPILYDGPRIQIDDTGFRGFVNHNSVQCDPKWRHTNRIEPAQFQEALVTTPTQTNAEDGMIYQLGEGPTARWFQVQSNYPVEINGRAAFELIASGAPHTKNMDAGEIHAMAVRYERLHGNP